MSASARELSWFMALRTASSSGSNGGAGGLEAVVFVFVEICRLLCRVIGGTNGFDGEVTKEKNTVH